MNASVSTTKTKWTSLFSDHFWNFILWASELIVFSQLLSKIAFAFVLHVED